MERLVLSTDDVSERERFSFWRETNEALLGVRGERNKDQEAFFSGNLAATIGASFTRLRFHADGSRVFCRLLAVACGAGIGDHHEALRSARIEAAKRYIELHLADPGLTPAKAAAALNISVRQLHLVFEPGGTSFAQYLLCRRLEECRAAL